MRYAAQSGGFKTPPKSVITSTSLAGFESEAGVRLGEARPQRPDWANAHTRFFQVLRRGFTTDAGVTEAFRSAINVLVGVYRWPVFR